MTETFKRPELTPEQKFRLQRINRPFDPNRKRYYIADVDLATSRGDYDWMNWPDCKQPLQPGQIPKAVIIPAGKDMAGREVDHIRSWGVARFRETPRVKVALKNKPQDVYGNVNINFVISSRAKSLLERIDPEGFEFVECETTTRKSLTLDSYWIAGLKRVVTEFDEEKSNFRWGGAPEDQLISGKVRNIGQLYNIYFMPDLPDDYHSFWMLQHSTFPIFDEAIVDAWRAAKLRGLRFSPIQPASKEDLKRIDSFNNMEYYYEFGRNDWGHKEP